MTQIPTTRVEAEALDTADPLGPVRALFQLDPELIYLDGHSLGAAPAAALEAASNAAADEWARGLIRSWNDAGWFDLPLRVGDQIARIIGAKAGEVIVTDSVSVNLFKLAGAALPLARTNIVIVEEDDFPTDQYIAQGLAGLADARFERVPAGTGPDRAAATGGILILSAVNYRTAAVLEMAPVDQAVTSGGGRVVWDLSHAGGVLNLDLSSIQMAAGCTYKYLCGGPGAPAYIYARRDIQESLLSPLPGWMGHARPFAFDPSYAPAPGITRFANGTPPILSLRALGAGLSVFETVTMADVEAKARALGDLVCERTHALGLPIISPTGEDPRGGHVTVCHEDGYGIVQALIARRIIPDFRAPDAIRFGLAPLPLSWVEVWDAMAALGDILETAAYKDPKFQVRATVT